jgi:hypothetical protein
MKLDRSQPFGTVCGDASGVAYEQNHQCFDVNGDLIGEPAVKEKAKPGPKAKTPVDDQLAAQMGNA